MNKFRAFARNIVETLVYLLSLFSNRDSKIMVFGSWFGTKMADNSFYFLKYLVDHDFDQDYRLIWIGKSSLREEVESQFHGRVAFYERNSFATFRLLMKAKYGFVSNGMTDLGTLVPNGKMVLVQLWHGFPFKKIGADMPQDHREGSHLFDKFSYYLSTSELMTDRILTAFRNYGISREKIINSGQPRDSIFFDTKKSPQIKSELRNSMGIPDDAFVVSYLPTFRDSNSSTFSFMGIGEEFEAQLAKKNIFIIEKRHHFRFDEYKMQSEGNILQASDDIDTQNLLIATDLLITDYSSVYADFMFLDRPIIHYLYDGDYYLKSDRGLYTQGLSTTFAGPTITDQSELIDYILNHTEKDFLSQQRHQLNALVNQYSAKEAGEIIVGRLGISRGKS